MANINIKKRIKVGKRWTFAPLVECDGMFKADHCMVNGQPEEHKEGIYYVEWYDGTKRIQRRAGKTLVAAQEAAHNQLRVFALKAEGFKVEDSLPILYPEKASRAKGTNLAKVDEPTIAEAAEKFLRYKENKNVKDVTLRKYRLIFERFQKQFGSRTPITKITADSIIEFLLKLKDQDNLCNETRKLHGVIVLGALRKSKAIIPFDSGDWPQTTQQDKRDPYEIDQLTAFFAACTQDERMLFDFFLHTGFRDAEVGYVTWSDVDFKRRVIRVRSKPELGFTIKNYMEREVPVPKFLWSELAAWKKRSAEKYNPHDLVFPSDPHGPEKPGGKRDFKMLNKCKAIAFRAGLNCGKCEKSHGRCDCGPYCEEWILHRFRHTYATYHLRSEKPMDICTLQRYLGHKDIANTMIYLKPARGEAAQKTVNESLMAMEFSHGGYPENVISIAAGGR